MERWSYDCTMQLDSSLPERPPYGVGHLAQRVPEGHNGLLQHPLS